MKKLNTNYLTKEKELELINIILSSTNGEGLASKKALFHMCDFIVMGIVSKYPNPEISSKELFLTGKKACEKAFKIYIDKKRYKKKFKFATYGTYFVKKAIEKRLLVNQ